MALKDVNIVLVPESKFVFDGPCGLLYNVEKQLEQSRHCVIVCAEGAGQDLLEESGETDASSNKVLSDICTLIRAKMKTYFEEKEMDVTLKFIDPSYIIRSIPANSNDRIYCGFWGRMQCTQQWLERLESW